MDNPIEKAILAATCESLQSVNEQLCKDVADLINQRTDIPKLAIQIIGKRLMLLRNTKVQLLTLELIEYCAYTCEIPFYSQLGSSDFLQRLNTILNPQMNKQVQQRALQVIAVLHQLMNQNPDLFPTFFQFVQKIQQKGLQIQNNYESKYAYLGKQVSSQKPTSSLVSALSASENPKTAKLKKDLEIVKSNINLTNEIIDSSNPSEDVSRNDILSDMMKTLKGVEDKLSNLITNMSGNDETMMSYCLELNDDLMKTFQRYDALKKHNKPLPFKTEAFKFTAQQPQQQTEWKIFQQPSQPFQPIQVAPIVQQKPIPSKQIDLLDLFEDSAADVPKVQQAPKPQQVKQQQVIDLFDEPVQNQPTFSPQIQQQPQQQQYQQQQQEQQKQQPQVPNIQNLYNIPVISAQQPNQPQQQDPNQRYAAFNQPTYPQQQVYMQPQQMGGPMGSQAYQGQMIQKGQMQQGYNQGPMQPQMSQMPPMNNPMAMSQQQMGQMGQQVGQMSLSQQYGGQGQMKQQPTGQKKPFDDLDDMFAIPVKKQSKSQQEQGGDLI